MRKILVFSFLFMLLSVPLFAQKEDVFKFHDNKPGPIELYNVRINNKIKATVRIFSARTVMIIDSSFFEKNKALLNVHTSDEKDTSMACIGIYDDGPFMKGAVKLGNYTVCKGNIEVRNLKDCDIAIPLYNFKIEGKEDSTLVSVNMLKREIRVTGTNTFSNNSKYKCFDFSMPYMSDPILNVPIRFFNRDMHSAELNGTVELNFLADIFLYIYMSSPKAREFYYANYKLFNMGNAIYPSTKKIGGQGFYAVTSYVGDVCSSKCPVVVYGKGLPRKVDGTLGRRFFKQHHVVFDYGANKVYIK